jgi:arylformamidase
VGLDALGVERDQPGYPTHRALLEQGIIILEGLRLKDVPPGIYRLLALPLLLMGAEAAPARVVLLEKRRRRSPRRAYR